MSTLRRTSTSTTEEEEEQAPPNNNDGVLLVAAAGGGAVCSKKKACTNLGIPCALRSCQKLICIECYHAGVLQRNNISLSEALPNNKVACTLSCHKKAAKESAADPSRISWDDDTPNGNYEGSSEALLLDWLKSPGNYAKWRGNNRGITKVTIQQEVANMINAHGASLGISRERNEKQVGYKISFFEKKFRKTLSFMENTGQGIKDDQNLSEDKFKALISTQWPHFWDLYDIMSERSCMRQVFPSEDLGGDSSNNASSCSSIAEQEDSAGDIVGLDDEEEEDNGNDDEVLVEDNGNDDEVLVVAGEQDDEDQEEDDQEEAPPQSPVRHVLVPTSTPPTASSSVGMSSSAGGAGGRASGRRQQATGRKRTASTAGVAQGGAAAQQRDGQSSVSGSIRGGSGTRRGQSVPHVGEMLVSVIDLLNKNNNDNTNNNPRRGNEDTVRLMELEETKRHNMQVELDNRNHQAHVQGIERTKAANDHVRAEAELTITLFRQYKELKEQNYSLESIARLFPPLIKVFPEDELSIDQKRRFATLYNTYYIKQGLPSRIDFFDEE